MVKLTLQSVAHTKSMLLWKVVPCLKVWSSRVLDNLATQIADANYDSLANTTLERSDTAELPSRSQVGQLF